MIPWLDPQLPPHFPDTWQALDEPNGLLAAGGQLNLAWLSAAYRRGIFPWFNENEPLLWWTPAPRTVLFPSHFRINRSLRKFLKKKPYRITIDHRFSDVMQACAEPRRGQPGSWISQDMIYAYTELFEAGLAHSYECWNEQDVLVGGLYGVCMGKVFFGESMFSRQDNASKFCLKTLVDCGQYQMIDCQMNTPHMMRMGAEEIPREKFERLLQRYIPDSGQLV